MMMVMMKMLFEILWWLIFLVGFSRFLNVYLD